MSYIGRAPTDTGEFLQIDEISSSFDGSTRSFDLQIGTSPITPTKENIIVALDGVLQTAGSAYSISGSTVTFTEAPTAGTTFYGILTGQVGASVANNAITDDHVSGTANISGSKINTDFGAQSVTAKVFSGGVISGSGQVSDALPTGVMSGSAQTKANLPTGTVSASMGISGSSTSTGSFGRAELTTIGGGNLTFDGSTLAVTGNIDPSDQATSRTNLGLGTGDSPTFTGQTLTGVLDVPDGSAAAPSIANTGDTDTGIFFAADNAVGFATAGEERIRTYETAGVGYLELKGSNNNVIRNDAGYINLTANSELYLRSAAANDVNIADNGGDINLTGAAGIAASQDLQTNGSEIMISVASDMRLKNDKGEIQDALSKVNQLTARYYTWKENNILGLDSSVMEAGFFAQEGFDVFPEGFPRSENLIPALDEQGEPQLNSKGKTVQERVVDEDGNPDYHWGVNSRALISLLARAIQELSAKVEVLESA